jgi:hypothetical protein
VAAIGDHARRGSWARVSEAGWAAQKEVEQTLREVFADTLDR